MKKKLSPSPLIPLSTLQKLKLVPARKSPAPTQVMLVDAAGQGVCGVVVGVPKTFRGKPGERLDLVDGASRSLVVGCGKRPAAAEDSRAFWEGAGAAVAQALQAANVDEAELAGPLGDGTAPFALGALLAGYDNQLYRKAPGKDAWQPRTLRVPGLDAATLARTVSLADAINWARALVEAPANHLTPAAFVDEVRALADFGIEVEVLDLAALEKLGAHGLLAVGRSSVHPPYLAVARWNGRGKRNRKIDLAIAAKGLTFDAGGLNLKMVAIDKMKLDMGGAAGAIGALRVMAERRAPINAMAVLALCENVIAADAYRPGDVIGSLEGLTIEVANADAEGRIVLADAITYAKRQDPALLVDMATLTGSIAGTFHHEFAGLYCNDGPLLEMLQAAADSTGDALWRMPLSPLHDYVVESDIADVRNLGAPGVFGNAAGSSIAGAKFLERFAKDARWAHLDMASTVLTMRPKGPIKPGPTGWGVRLLADVADRIARKPQATAKS